MRIQQLIKFQMNRFYALIISLSLIFGLLSGCGYSTPSADSVGSSPSPAASPSASISPSPAVSPSPSTSSGAADVTTLDPIDYAASIKLDMSSETAKQEVTVKTFIDGDTTHFHVPTNVMNSGVFKARFLAVNTPESTGKIEEYGKKASQFTKEKLSTATSIILESETGTWNADSTGGRYLTWVWYKSEEMSEYRNLNIEILQNGLAIASNSANNRYGDICMNALNQARALKLNVHSGEPDPDFYYGEAIELTLKELRTNIDSYNGMKVAFNGIISANSGTQGVYIEDFDAETNLHYGIYIYYGHNLSGHGLDVLSVGNEARIVGTVQYYEGGGTWQVSDLTYRLMKPNDPGNIQKLSSGNAAAYVLTDPATFKNGSVTLDTESGAITAPYAAMILGTSVEMKNLQVTDIYTTTNEESSSKGAMTLTCQAVDGTVITVRTALLFDENNNLITEDAYAGKVLDIKGIVDYFDGTYQIKVFSSKNISITK